MYLDISQILLKNPDSERPWCGVLYYCIDYCTAIIHGFFFPFAAFFFSYAPTLSDPATPSEKRARHNPLTCTAVMLKYESISHSRTSAYARQSGGLVCLVR